MTFLIVLQTPAPFCPPSSRRQCKQSALIFVSFTRTVHCCLHGRFVITKSNPVSGRKWLDRDANADGRPHNSRLNFCFLPSFSVCLCLSHSYGFSLCLSLLACPCFCLCPTLSVAKSLCVCLSVSVFPSLCVSVSPPLSSLSLHPNPAPHPACASRPPLLQIPSVQHTTTITFQNKTDPSKE